MAKKAKTESVLARETRLRAEAEARAKAEQEKKAAEEALAQENARALAAKKVRAKKVKKPRFVREKNETLPPPVKPKTGERPARKATAAGKLMSQNIKPKTTGGPLAGGDPSKPLGHRGPTG